MTAAEIEKKIEVIQTPPVNKVAAAFSGGLDSSLSIELLRRKYRAKEIIPITVDIGQGDEEIEQSKLHARALGIEPIFVDVKEDFAGQWVSMAIKAIDQQWTYMMYHGEAFHPLRYELAKLCLKPTRYEISKKIRNSNIEIRNKFE